MSLYYGESDGAEGLKKYSIVEKINSINENIHTSNMLFNRKHVDKLHLFPIITAIITSIQEEMVAVILLYLCIVECYISLRYASIKLSSNKDIRFTKNKMKTVECLARTERNVV